MNALSACGFSATCFQKLAFKKVIDISPRRQYSQNLNKVSACTKVKKKQGRHPNLIGNLAAAFKFVSSAEK